MSLILSKFGKLNNFVQNGRSICAYRYFSIATNGCREVELNYLDKNAQGVAVIGLNRPSAKNAFSRTLVKQFAEIVDSVQHDQNVRVLILRSLAPGIFCAGADLKERATFTPAEVNQFLMNLRQLLNNVERLPMPTIAALDGAALGGGLELALCCDLLTVAKDAKLGLVETSRAIIPGAGGTQRLPRRLGPSLAKELIFTSRILTGQDATRIGICNHAVDQNSDRDAAYQKALELAMEILPNGPIGVKLAKQAINRGIEVDLSTGLAIEEACYAQTIPTKDRLEGLKAFAEKRKPNYKGE